MRFRQRENAHSVIFETKNAKFITKVVGLS